MTHCGDYNVTLIIPIKRNGMLMKEILKRNIPVAVAVT